MGIGCPGPPDASIETEITVCTVVQYLLADNLGSNIENYVIPTCPLLF